MRRVLVGLVAALALTFGVASPAQASPTVAYGHWSYYKWGPVAQPIRAFYVFDRTRDNTVHQALQSVINDLKYDLEARGAWGVVPAPVYIQDDANFGQCDSTPFSSGNGFQNFPGYSFSTVCAGGRGGGTSITWTSGLHYGENYHPSIHVQREYADYNTTYTHLVHELLHAMGLGHTSNCADLMGGAEFGCRITPGVLKKPSPQDYDGLTNFYGGYGAFAHPWWQ